VKGRPHAARPRVATFLQRTQLHGKILFLNFICGIRFRCKLPKFCLQFSNQGALIICKVSNSPLSKEETENLYLVILLRLLTGSAFCFNGVSLPNSCSRLLFLPHALEQLQHKLIHLNHSEIYLLPG